MAGAFRRVSALLLPLISTSERGTCACWHGRDMCGSQEPSKCPGHARRVSRPHSHALPRPSSPVSWMKRRPRRTVERTCARPSKISCHERQARASGQSRERRSAWAFAGVWETSPVAITCRAERRLNRLADQHDAHPSSSVTEKGTPRRPPSGSPPSRGSRRQPGHHSTCDTRAERESRALRSDLEACRSRPRTAGGLTIPGSGPLEK